MTKARGLCVQHGQAMAEYLLLFALIALVTAAGLLAWKPALAGYLQNLAKVLTQAR